MAAREEGIMRAFLFGSKSYEVDDQGFLLDHRQWDDNFAEGMARQNGISGGLGERHWSVIRFLRQKLQQTGQCPVVFETCRANKLHLRDLKRLFPTGYLRGACKLAGIAYGDRAKKFCGEENASHGSEAALRPGEKWYRVTALGFLAVPTEWDEDFAIFKAQELGMVGGLTERHWEVIRFLRQSYAKTGTPPTVYETSEALGLELEELERLFPTGYHRGAVKLSGLRAV
jgi:tRNA 2-thiouridine synthesizing protein E